jgi:hypothetical protein
MIAWSKLTPEEVLYVLNNVPDPLAVFIGVPEARQNAEQRLGSPNVWVIDK